MSLNFIKVFLESDIHLSQKMKLFLVIRIYIFGMPFHPEGTHSKEGEKILFNSVV